MVLEDNKQTHRGFTSHHVKGHMSDNFDGKLTFENVFFTVSASKFFPLETRMQLLGEERSGGDVHAERLFQENRNSPTHQCDTRSSTEKSYSGIHSIFFCGILPFPLCKKEFFPFSPHFSFGLFGTYINFLASDL